MRHEEILFVQQDDQLVSVHSKYTSVDGTLDSTRHIGNMIYSGQRWLFSAKTVDAPMAVFDQTDLRQIYNKLCELNAQHKEEQQCKSN